MTHSTDAVKKIVLAITGASGTILGVRTLQALHALGIETHVIVSTWAERTMRTEMRPIVDLGALSSYSYSEDNMAARISSGSFRTDGMIIVPCSMNTVASVAHGITSNLIHRAADVTLKERNRLVVVPRETPLNLIHLRNLTTLTEAGATVLPPVPGFYNRPETIEDLIQHLVSRILDQLDIPNDLTRRWTSPSPEPTSPTWDEIAALGAREATHPNHKTEPDGGH